jgi:hypothetical protein
MNSEHKLISGSRDEIFSAMRSSIGHIAQGYARKTILDPIFSVEQDLVVNSYLSNYGHNISPIQDMSAIETIDDVDISHLTR